MSEEGLTTLLSLGAALTAGFIIGAEREQTQHASFAGVRTFPLFALAGALGALVHVALLVSLAVGLIALLSISYLRDGEEEEDGEEARGLSSEMAALVTFALGALSVSDIGIELVDRLLLVGAGTAAVLALLGFKRRLHDFVSKISKPDIYAATKLLLLSMVLLPILPNEEMGPWDALNPRTIGILVVLISALGFAGYVAVRLFGPNKGLGLTGILGGLASSTAVTLTFSGRAKESPELTRACAVAIILAGSTMFPRLGAELLAVSPALAARAAGPLGASTLVGFLAGGWLYRKVSAEGRREAHPPEPIKIKNPFTMGSALKFAGVFTLVLIFSKAASTYFAEAGVYLSAVVTGVADVDPITLSIAHLHAEDALSDADALLGFGLAVTSNTLSKIGLTYVVGGRRLASLVGTSLLIALAAGAVVAMVLSYSGTFAAT